MLKIRSILVKANALALRARLLAITILIGWLSSASMALPEGHVVKYGSVTVQYFSDYIIVTSSSSKCIINWNKFNLSSDEQINFLLPSSSSSVLNRINSANGISFINGVLSSNGRVYLVNSAGIVFGSSSILNASRIYAAAGDMSDADFLSGTDRFTNLTGTIENHGTITGDEVHFAGNRIVNSATGNVTGGLVTFSTGEEVYIRRIGDGISIRIDGEDLGDPEAGSVGATLSGTAGIENHGTITATDGGAIHLAAGDIYGLAILNTGTIEASGGGDIELSARGGAIHNAVGGMIDASGSAGGGTITIQGPSVVNEGTLKANANTGPAGDITVRAYNNAIFTDKSSIQANSNLNGDGGNISIEATHGTVVLAEGGTVNATGGLLGGDGGSVEVSGEQVAYYATTKVSASSGTDGLLSVSVGESVDVYAPGAPIGDPGSLDLDGAIAVTSRVGTNVLDGFDGNVEINSDNDISLSQGFDLRGHDLTLDAGGNANLYAEATGLNNLDVTAVDRIQMGTSFTDIAGDATFTSPEIFAVGSAPITIDTVGTQTWDGNVQLNTDLSILASDASFSGDIDGNHALAVDVAGELDIFGDMGATEALSSIDLAADLTTFWGNQINADGDILIHAAGRAALPSSATIVGMSDSLSIVSANGDIRLGQHEVFTQLGDLTLQADGVITIGDINTNGNMLVDAANIEVLSHDGGNVLMPDGSLAFLDGVHYLANGTITFTSTPTVLGSGSGPVFASTEASPSASGTLSSFDWIDNAPLGIDDFMSGGTVLNVIPVAADNSGADDASDSTPEIPRALNTLVTDIAAAEQLGNEEDDEPFDNPAVQEGVLTLVTLQDLSIDIEQVRQDPQGELGAISRTDILANYPMNNINPETGNIRVKQRRLNAGMVDRTLQEYQDVLARQPGDPLANINANDTTGIADSIQSSWTQYNAAAGATGTVEGFRSYLQENGSQADSRQYVDGLRTVFQDLGLTGLTSGEVAYARARTAQRILDSGSSSSSLSAGQFNQLIR